MRKDAIGMFWVEEPKVVIKRDPPYPYWEEEGYAPDWEKAKAFVEVMPVIQDHELNMFQLPNEKQELFWDIEVYPNYALILFEHKPTGKYIDFCLLTEDSTLTKYQIEKLNWLFDQVIVVGFNSNGYDCVIANLALCGRPVSELKYASDLMIQSNLRKEEIYKQFKIRPRKFDSIDLIEVAPLKASLKIYGGRLHTKKMQDLPFPPETFLTFNQTWIVHNYCANDLVKTKELRDCLDPQIKLRIEMTKEYGADLRSKSDAQIAETVIVKEIKDAMGVKHLQRPLVEPGKLYKYNPPHFLQYNSELMKHVLNVIRTSDFEVAQNGSIIMPKAVDDLKIKINKSEYQMGIGGLHSCEKSAAHLSRNGYTLRDRDVASYYPMIILICQLFPGHLGRIFLSIYEKIVNRRLHAKKSKMKAIADSLKIVINGSFGKLGSMWSMLYAPNLMIQVTVTGQLSLLMLIERFELAGIEIVSANTDGIVINCHDSQTELYEKIIKQWELDTGFETEETVYDALYSRDVNNYMAIKRKFDKETNQWTDKISGFKGKGIFADPWSDPENPAMVLHKNPCAQICINAAYQHITTGKPLLDLIKDCKDISQFVSVRTVKGGAFKEGVGYLGKSVRWYYAKGQDEPIIYANSGNKVPKSDGAKPCMELPDIFPDDIDYNWYAQESHDMLVDIGYYPKDFPYIPF